MDPVTAGVLGGSAAINMLGSYLQSKAAQEEAERQKKLQMTQDALTQQQQGVMGSIGNQQNALNAIVQNMKAGF